jgi:purine-binding chemotaxis protein CheW
MASTVSVVEFVLGGERYALDIQLAREIVEMIPITPIPRAPPYISGVINLRGEITNIMNLNTLLGLPPREIQENQKIIVLVPEAASGNNVGVIVDEVTSVLQVSESDIEHLGEGLSSEVSGFVKGIIKPKSDGPDQKSTGLIIWIDMQRVLEDIATK